MHTCFCQAFQPFGQECFLYLYRFKGVDFLNDFYGVEHLQSIDDAVDDLIVICKKTEDN